MKNVQEHRVVPVAMVMTIIMSCIGLFEVVVVAGGLEIKSSTIKRIAPWAYAPFLRMVGEHPEQFKGTEADTKPKMSSSIAGLAKVAGFSADELDITLEGTEPVNLETILEPTVPVPEIIEPTEVEPIDPADVEPVG